jgi:hypothetical protein
MLKETEDAYLLGKEPTASWHSKYIENSTPNNSAHTNVSFCDECANHIDKEIWA